MPDLHELTALDLGEALRRREVSAEEATRHFLQRIERGNAAVGAVTGVAAERAVERARALDAGASRSAPLWGLPIVDKELVRRAGQRTTFGSRLFADHVPETDDELVQHLDAAGAISLGTSAAPEFGLPSYTASRVAPPARSPYALDRGAGGSSGGAAAAVAAGLVPFAPGSDGGGSIRIPAAACGVVGLKPSRGRIPAASGLDRLAGLVVAGPIARTVADAALMLDALVSAAAWPHATQAAIDPPLASGAPHPSSGSFLGAAVRGEGRYQLGVMTASPWQEDVPISMAPEARWALDRAIEGFAALGHGLDDIDLAPEPDYGRYFRTIWKASAAGIPARTPTELQRLEPLTRWLVEQGRAMPASELASALEWLAGFERRVIARLRGVDAVLTPALAMTPRPLDWYDPADAERNFAQQVQYTPWTSFVNVAGLPALVLPVGVTPPDADDPGMPMAVQLIGRPGGEATLLSLGAQWERSGRGRLPRPPVW